MKEIASSLMTAMGFGWVGGGRGSGGWWAGCPRRRCESEVEGRGSGGGAGRGREGGFCGLRRDVSTVDGFDKGSRINGLIAGVRVALRIGWGWRAAVSGNCERHLPAPSDGA